MIILSSIARFATSCRKSLRITCTTLALSMEMLSFMSHLPFLINVTEILEVLHLFQSSGETRRFYNYYKLAETYFYS